MAVDPAVQICFGKDRHRTFEYRAEGWDQSMGDLVNLARLLKNRGHRSDARSRDAARDDQIKKGKIRTHVQRETMTGDPAADVNSHGCDFSALGPHTREIVMASRADAVQIQDPKDHFLEISHIAAHIELMGSQLENRITDQRAWPVICDVAAAIDFASDDSSCRQRFLRNQQMAPCPVA